MKRFKYMFLAILLSLSITGLVYAANISSFVDPQTGGAELWTQSVYNNSATQINANEIVVWDYSSATGDDDNWVATTTTAETQLVAGVAFADIPGNSAGTIVIRGVYAVEMVVGSPLGARVCTSGTAGSGTSVACAATDNYLGVVVEAQGGAADTKVFINPR